MRKTFLLPFLFLTCASNPAPVITPPPPAVTDTLVIVQSHVDTVFIVDTVFVSRKDTVVNTVVSTRVDTVVVSRSDTVFSSRTDTVFIGANPLNNTVIGDLVVTGKLSVGGPVIPGADAQLQIHGLGSAEILARSNEGNLDSQSETHSPHVIVWSGGNDGGARIIQGAYWGTGGRQWRDTSRPLTVLALDSRGTLSESQEFSGVPITGQLWVIQREGARLFFTAMQPGSSWGFRASTTLNSFDRSWIIPFP
jgi:hypothetical protein